LLTLVSPGYSYFNKYGREEDEINMTLAVVSIPHERRAEEVSGGSTAD
jgi:sulfite reductase alpha subunit-like flavoprotein